MYAEIVRALHRARARRNPLPERRRARSRRATASRRARRPRQRIGCTSCRPTASGCAIRRRPASFDEAGGVALVNWRFNAWAKYENYALDAKVGAAVARITGLSTRRTDAPGHRRARRARGRRHRHRRRGHAARDRGVPAVGRPGAQSRTRRADGYERVFRDALGIRQTIWLGEGCVGDDTHGHVDDIARFAAPGVIALAYEEDPADDENHRRSADNLDVSSWPAATDGEIARRQASLPAPGHR